MATALLIIMLETLVLGAFWVWDGHSRRAARRLRHDRQGNAGRA